MFRVMIADDEPIFRTGLRSIVGWRDYGCEIVGEASNGLEVLSLIREKKPDIVFLDIKMPSMDGIEVLKRFRQEPDSPCFIVLSCFNEYDYVREAMKLGAMDYLFKPLMEGPDIEKVLQEACEKLGGSQISAEDRKREEQLREALTCVLSGEGDGAEQLFSLRPDLRGRDCFTAAFSLQEDGLSDKLLVLLDSCQGAVSGFFDSCDCLFARQGKTLFLLAFSTAQNAVFPAPPRQRQLHHKLRDLLEAQLWIGFDRPAECGRNLSESFRRASLAAEANFFQPENAACVLSFEPCMEGPCDYEQLCGEELAGLREAVLRYDEQGASQWIWKILGRIREARLFHRENFCHFLAVLITDSMRVYRNRIVLEELLLSNYHLISDLYHQKDAEDTVQLFLQILQTLFAHLKGSTPSLHTRLLQEILVEINEHYAEKLTLEAFAEKMHLSVNYFCKLFKDQTGDTFVNYLNKARIHAAVQLLRTTPMKTYEIAEAVGFSDYRYFCKMFKKITDLTPSQVREKL